ncbi:MAG: RING finger protein [Armatimonadota bacterium]
MTIPSVVGKTCPYCQTPLKPDANVVLCSSCGMPHHQECWMENGRCTTYGCSGTPQLVSGAGINTVPPVQPMAAISMPPPPQMAVTYAPMQAPVAQDMYLEGTS